VADVDDAALSQVVDDILDFIATEEELRGFRHSRTQPVHVSSTQNISIEN